MRIGPGERELLRAVAAANDVGAAYLVRATRTTSSSRSRIIGGMIGHGLLVDHKRSIVTQDFFSTSQRGYSLQITELGRECLVALGSKA